MNKLWSAVLRTLEQDSIPADHLNEVACVVVSMVVHFGLILPLLALWINVKSDSPAALPRVMVHLTAPRRPERAAPAASGGRSRRPSHTLPASRPVAARPVRPRVVPVPRSRPSAVQPLLSDTGLPRAPSYPQASSGRDGASANGGRSGFGTAGNGVGRGPGGPGGLGGRGHQVVQVDAVLLKLPTNVPMSQSLQKVDLRNFEVIIYVEVDVAGKAKVKIKETSGNAEFDQLVVQQIELMPWQPATRDGVPSPSSTTLTIRGDLQPGATSFSLHQA